MKTKNKTFIFLFCVFLTGSVQAGPGKDGFQFLNALGGARQISMGETGVSVADDVNAVYWNPAALGEVRGRQMSFSYAAHMASMNSGSLSYAHPLKKGTLSGSLNVFNYGDIQGYDISGTKTKNIKAQDFLYSISYGQRALKNSAWGLTVKQISESIDNNTGSALALDIGVVQKIMSSPLQLGASMRNIGGKAKFIKEKTSLPQELDFGVSYKTLADALTLSLEIHKPGDNKTTLCLGQEMWFNNIIAFRAGYQTNKDLGNGLNLGLGLKFKNVHLDYAFLGNGKTYDETHRIGITYRFGGAGDKSYQEGLTLSQKGYYAEAILKFKEALDAEPGHRKAMRGMKEAVRLLKQERK